MGTTIWGPSSSENAKEKYPYEILEQYAQRLTVDTDGRIEGVVTETTVPIKEGTGLAYDRMVYALYLVVPFLRNSSYRLIEVEHLTFGPYPVNIKLYGQDAHNVVQYDNILTALEFDQRLKELIQHDLTKMLISHIYTMIDIKKTA